MATHKTHKALLFGPAARSKMLVGAKTASDFVGATLGPKGRTIVIEREVVPPDGMNAETIRYTHTTKDGVTVARALELTDKQENLGLELIREAATQTVRMAGDGTTTATVLAHAIYAGGLAALDEGANPIHIKSGIEKAVHLVIKNLEAATIPCTPSMKTQIATISANGDESIASFVLEAMDAAGPDGVISLDFSKTIDTYVEVSRGMKIDSGMVAENFITNPERGECVMTDVCVLLFQRSIKNITPLMPLFEWLAKNNKSLLLLSESFETELLQISDRQQDERSASFLLRASPVPWRPRQGSPVRLRRLIGRSCLHGRDRRQAGFHRSRMARTMRPGNDHQVKLHRNRRSRFRFRC